MNSVTYVVRYDIHEKKIGYLGYVGYAGYVSYIQNIKILITLPQKQSLINHKLFFSKWSKNTRILHLIESNQ